MKLIIIERIKKFIKKLISDTNDYKLSWFGIPEYFEENFLDEYYCMEHDNEITCMKIPKKSSYLNFNDWDNGDKYIFVECSDIFITNIHPNVTVIFGINNKNGIRFIMLRTLMKNRDNNELNDRKFRCYSNSYENREYVMLLYSSIDEFKYEEDTTILNDYLDELYEVIRDRINTTISIMSHTSVGLKHFYHEEEDEVIMRRKFNSVMTKFINDKISKDL